ADLDGDGTADVVGFGDEGIYAAISTGDGFTDGALWVEDFSFEKQWHWELNPRFLADMNGDRRADVVGFGDDGVMVALSEAGQEFGRPRILVSGFGSEDGWSPERHLRMVTDLDADGRADIVGFGEKGITVFRSNLPVPETPAQPKWVEAGKTAAPAPLDEPDKAVGPEFPTGWRGDGTGRYPKAESPRIWSADDKVIWKTALPSGSNATPVVVGDRVFACSEPSDLICLDRENGKILWQVSSLRTETMTEEDERLARENEEKSRGVGKELNALRNELNGVRMKLKKDPKNGDLFSRFSKLKREVALKNREYEKLVGYLQPRTQSVNGYSSPTPVSDGQSIYVLYGTGVAASYDLVGHRHWIRFIEAPDHIWGHSASPRLAGSVLVVHINDLRGLNSETGQDIWRVKLPPSWGTPIIAAIPETGAENSPLAHVIVTPQGDVARADTGNILARRLFRMPYGSPLLEENVVYAVDQQGAVAIRLPESMEGGFQTEELWRTRPRRDRYYASPVLAGGYLHAANSTHYYSVLDARTGEVAYETKMPFGSGAIYPSLCLAGGLVYLSNEDGRTLLVEPGPGLKTVADNTLEPFRATPVFRDGRMYVRTLENLYCIGQ
ncbi:PQQ-binding-like beta-propeller repeat protein, partial [bacterium]|nr:PQQ-binding-like beta-propeller repeat protein [bacterium]